MPDKIIKNSTTMNQNCVNNDDIDLRDLLSIIWMGKWTVLAIIFLFALVAVVYSINEPNIYRSEALLAPVEQEQSLGGLQGQLGGLASLAGISLGSGSSNKTQLAVEILKSRDFVGKFIKKHDILLDLMAADTWNISSNTIAYDQDLYNIDDNNWVRKVSLPYTSIPSIQEAYKVFVEHMNVSINKDTGMITLSIDHISPYIAQQWLSWLIEDINQTMKIRDVVEAEESTAFLTKQIEQTKIADIRDVLYKLIEEQAKTIMFANVREEYVFTTIDPALVPEVKSGPKRALICILGTMLGAMVGCMTVLIRFFARKNV